MEVDCDIARGAEKYDQKLLLGEGMSTAGATLTGASAELHWKGELSMDPFKHDRTECRCVDDELNRRVLCADPSEAGRVYVYLSADDVKEVAAQFSRYGVLEAGELPGPGDQRIYAVEFECDLAAMLEKMLEAGFGDPAKEIAAWLLALQHCSKRLGEELLKLQGEEGPPRRF
jgi:hypothetical protein